MTSTDEPKKHAHRRLIALKLAIVAALALAIAELSIITRVDTAIVEGVHGFTGGPLDDVANGISHLAGTDAITLITVVAVAGLLALRHWRGAITLALAVIATQAVVAVVKALLARPRPADDMALGDPSGWSFPSAHSASSVAVYMTLALLATSLWRHQIRPAYAFASAGAVVVLVGLSRLYLGAHYPTDVVAGWLTGGAVVVAAWAVYVRLPHRVANLA